MSGKIWQAIVIGGSAGSLEALSRILPALPADFPQPVFVVVHLPPDKKSVMAELLQDKCVMTVKEAEDKEAIRPGTVYFAPPDYHLLIEADGSLSLSYEEPHLFSRPSIDVLFESAADIYGPGLVGVVLSGGNNDGAGGLRQILDNGGLAVVQDAREAYARAMPLAAIEECPEAHVLPAAEIAAFLSTPCPAR